MCIDCIGVLWTSGSVANSRYSADEAASSHASALRKAERSAPCIMQTLTGNGSTASSALTGQLRGEPVRHEPTIVK